VAYGATERNDGREEARRGLAECARFVRARRFPRVRGMVALHASFTVSDETVREAGELARALEAPLHVHVAEDRADVRDAEKRGFGGPFERLVSLEALVPGSILAHGVWLDEAAVRAADARAAWLVQNPRSNANNKVGYPRALGASTRVAIGTDGFAADMVAEHRALGEEAARNADPASPEILDARRGGGVRLAAELFDDLATDVVVGVPGAPPRRVVVGGRLVVDEGRLVHGDLEAIRAHAREEAARLWGRMNAL
jgi:cytosine/adenosine deaminase-related metal-dependent hydrolase